METITRKDARERGLKYYYTGKPCKNGHLTSRWVRSGACVLCEIDARKRTYERVKETYYQKRYQEHKEHILTQSAAWKENNKEYVKKQSKEYSKRNVDKIKRYHVQYHERKKEQKINDYQKEKLELATIMMDFYRDSDLEHLGKDVESIKWEQTFQTYVMWKILKTFNTLEVIHEHKLVFSNGSYGFIDLYIPNLHFGIEVKLDMKYQYKKIVDNQVSRYKTKLGDGNVVVVSPKGDAERGWLNIEQLFGVLQERINLTNTDNFNS